MEKNGHLSRGERLQIMLSPEELAVVDDFRFKQRMPSRAAAVRELFKLGLTVLKSSPASAGHRPISACLKPLPKLTANLAKSR
jgi:hypothetical protein